jgi:Fe2+ transport system protein B
MIESDDYLRHRMKQIEGYVAQLAYPATLPPRVKRMLAAKLHEIEQSFTEKQRTLSQETPSRQTLSKTPPAAKRLTTSISRAKKNIKDAQDKLKAMNLDVSYDGKSVVKVLTDAERQQQEAERKQKWHQLQKDQQAAAEEFRKLVQDLAEAQIQKERSKLPADLVAKMDQIATPKLLGAAPEQPVAKAVDGEVTNA